MVNRFNDSELNEPLDICLAPNGRDILVSDSPGSRIHVFDKNWNLVCSFGSFGKALGQFNRPACIHTCGSRILISEIWNRRIQIFDQDYQPISIINTGCFVRWFCLDRHGNIFLTDNDFVLMLDKNGIPVKTFGSCGKGDGQFDQPKGIGCNSLGQIIVADRTNKRIQIFSQQGQFLYLFQVPFFPLSIHIDSEDNILVTNDYGVVARGDNDYGIWIFSPNGFMIRQVRLEFNVRGFNSLYLMDRKLFAPNEDGSIYVFSNKRSEI